jgi:hypothetical protein
MVTFDIGRLVGRGLSIGSTPVACHGVRCVGLAPFLAPAPVNEDEQTAESSTPPISTHPSQTLTGLGVLFAAKQTSHTHAAALDKNEITFNGAE